MAWTFHFGSTTLLYYRVTRTRKHAPNRLSQGERVKGTGDSASRRNMNPHREVPLRVLSDVPLEEEVVLVRIDVAGDDVVPLLEQGIVPGCKLCPVRHAPAGGPTVYRVDGALVALRRETASCLCVRSALEAAGVLDSN